MNCVGVIKNHFLAIVDSRVSGISELAAAEECLHEIKKDINKVKVDIC